MHARHPVTILLIGLTAILGHPGSATAKAPHHLTVLYTSDELGYLKPCG